MIPEISHLPYHDRLKYLNLTTLELRRHRRDLIETFKILKGLEGIPSNRLFELNTSVTRGNSLKLNKPRSRLNIRYNNFWAYVKSKGQEFTGVAPLKNQDGFLQSDTKARANILNEQFKSVFTREDLSNIPDTGESDITAMQNIKIDLKGVHKLLKNLKVHKATGLDEIPAYILKTAADELAPALAILFQLSMDQGEIPQDWKQALVVPIFKKGDKHLPSNYRPVSLTSITCKLLEHIIHSNIMHHFDQHRVLCDNQHRGLFSPFWDNDPYPWNWEF